MSATGLHAQIELEMDAIRIIVDEVVLLLHDVQGRTPTLRERTAAAAFLAQFYHGIENILKRISSYCNVVLPSGETWHTELFHRFCMPPYSGLPLLFDDRLAQALAPYRRFRHVALHSYGFQLEWDRLVDGLTNLSSVFADFQRAITTFLTGLDPSVE